MGDSGLTGNFHGLIDNGRYDGGYRGGLGLDNAPYAGSVAHLRQGHGTVVVDAGECGLHGCGGLNDNVSIGGNIDDSRLGAGAI